MIASGRARCWMVLALVVCVGCVVLASAALARGEAPTVGGSVPSEIALSLGEASAFSRTVSAHHERVFRAFVPLEVTVTEGPVRLSIADGEIIAGRARGRLVGGSPTAVLSVPLRVAACRGGAYRSLDVLVDPVLEQWGEPVAGAPATICLRQTVRGRAPRTLRAYHKLLLVTITAAGP